MIICYGNNAGKIGMHANPEFSTQQDKNSGDTPAHRNPQTRAEMLKYRHLAEEARSAGDHNLAVRLDNYASQLADEQQEAMAVEAVHLAAQALQALSPFERGQLEIFWGPGGETAAKLALPQIRETLFGLDDLRGAELEKFADRVDYVIAIGDGIKYVETHYSPESYLPEIIVAEVQKDISEAPRNDLH
ncbi:MAG: hypothetical protein LC776_01580 [Acidobacteria bacterium]|nr:hypothetical protein [Acidobacteriota bacterium]